IITTSVAAGSGHGDTTEWFFGATTEIYHLPRFLSPERWHDFVYYLFASRNINVLWIVGSVLFYDMLSNLKREYSHLRVADLLFNTIGHAANNRKHAPSLDITFVENREVERWLIDAGATANELTLIPSGVDIARYQPRPKSEEVIARIGAETGELIVG